MRRTMAFISALLVTLAVSAREEDVLAQMDEYLAAMDHLTIADASEEADFMISCVTDSSLRSAVAEKAYNHFRYSKVMGSENVAIHIFDRWFATFDTVFGNIDDFDEAQFYAFVNRQSLIGVKGKTIALLNRDGEEISIPFTNGRKAVIYFYSTFCPKCLYTSTKLCELFKNLNPELDFFAVYTGENEQEWEEYQSRNLDIRSDSTAVYHLRSGDEDFVVAYGVIQTPRLFLLDEEGIITGRNLDADALSKLLR